jgi:hypothetical protein
MWQSLNIWERQQQIKIAFTKKLTADYIHEVLATAEFSIFCPSASSPKT